MAANKAFTRLLRGMGVLSGWGSSGGVASTWVSSVESTPRRKDALIFCPEHTAHTLPEGRMSL